jgi:hypothetical protein
MILINSFELYERQTHISSVLLLLILLCCAVIGLGRINNPNFFYSINKGFFQLKTQDKSFGESTRLTGGANLALTLNFFTTLGLGFFLFFYQNTSIFAAIIAAVAFTLAFVTIQQVGFRLTSLVSGQSAVSENLSFITNQVWFMGGILFLFLGLFWILNMKAHDLFSLIFFGSVAFISFIRILKGIVFASRYRISWYYIFLYLCTLEILPVFVTYKLIQMYFKMDL